MDQAPIKPLRRVPPAYGDSYDCGWIGFVRSFGFVSDAIQYGERWEREQTMPAVTHALVVTGPGTCVEALQGTGVKMALLANYLTDPRTKIYFRQPAPWTPTIGISIAAAAKGKIGARYDDMLIAEQAMADTIVGHWFNQVFKVWPYRLAVKFLTAPDEFICSYLASYALACQPEFKSRDILSEPLSGIDPQSLFQAALFEPFINDCSFQPN